MLGQVEVRLGQLRIQTYRGSWVRAGRIHHGMVTRPQGWWLPLPPPRGSEMVSSWNQDDTDGRGQAYNPELLAPAPRVYPP